VSTLAPPSSIVRPRRESPVSVDVVVPFWNEETVLGLLLDRLAAVFSPANLSQHRVRSVRYVMVDDGSSDGSVSVIASRIEAGLPAIVCRLTRNFGHQNAISAGLDLSRADVAAVIDADLQDPPELILDMLARWRDGFDVVYAQRRKRRENPLKVASYWLFYRVVAALADLTIPLDSGDFCLMDRKVVRAVCALPEKLRFPRGLRAWVGFRQTGVEYDRPTRGGGRSKYTLPRLYKLATDGVVSSSVRPLQLAQVFSVSYLLLILAGLAFFAWSSQAGVSPLVLAGYLLIITGNFVQVLCIYILGAYVGRTYLEVKGRPSYLVMDVIGDDEPAAPDRTP
jgi:dolichol-phosphate mannosyltransferase